MGAEAVKNLIAPPRAAATRRPILKEVIVTAKGQRKAKAIKRLKVISAFNRRNDRGDPGEQARWAWSSTRCR